MARRRPIGKPIRDGLTRADITVEGIRQRVRDQGFEKFFPFLDDDERERRRQETLARLRPGEGLWVFGYGSLMWNPAFESTEIRSGLVHGYHRQFCLWTPIGRGTPECPGLMLALERGGACRGLAMHIAPEKVENESRVIWLREMLSGAYHAVWVTVRTDRGKVPAVTFVINREHQQYAGGVSRDDTVKALATAAGQLGRARDYLHNLVLHLDELGLRDGPMHRLYDEVERYADAVPDGADGS